MYKYSISKLTWPWLWATILYTLSHSLGQISVITSERASIIENPVHIFLPIIFWLISFLISCFVFQGWIRPRGWQGAGQGRRERSWQECRQGLRQGAGEGCGQNCGQVRRRQPPQIPPQPKAAKFQGKGSLYKRTNNIMFIFLYVCISYFCLSLSFFTIMTF